ncbi:MAG: NUDIX domain-containing protein [Bacteroidia bacterium]|nr:NUDIX domain-containing protein [Bacteroidia bacterium]
MDMLSFRQPSRTFQVRAAGIARHGDRVLLHRSETERAWTLPGGRVDWMERAEETVRREFLEETGYAVGVGPLEYIVERFFTPAEGLRYHELGLFFRIGFETLPPVPAFEGQEGAGELKLYFRWFTQEELAQELVQPDFLRESLFEEAQGLRHVVAGS